MKLNVKIVAPITLGTVVLTTIPISWSLYRHHTKNRFLKIKNQIEANIWTSKAPPIKYNEYGIPGF